MFKPLKMNRELPYRHLLVAGYSHCTPNNYFPLIAVYFLLEREREREREGERERGREGERERKKRE